MGFRILMVTKGGTRRWAGCAGICLWIASRALQGRGDCEECSEPWLRQARVISSSFQRHGINQYCFVDRLARHTFFFLGEHPVSVCSGKDAAGERGWLCPLRVQLSENWIFILPGTKQSQPKPEIIITKESCLGSSHQPREQLVWDILKHFFFFMARQF